MAALGIYDARDVVSVSFNGYGGAHLHMKPLALAAMLVRASEIYDCKVTLADKGEGRYIGTVTVRIDGAEVEASLTAISDTDGVLKRFITTQAVLIDPFAGLGGSTVVHEVVAERGDVVAVAPALEPLPQPAVDDDDRPW